MSPSTLLSILMLTLSMIFISYADETPLPPPGVKLYEFICKDAGNQKDRCIKLLEPYPDITSAKDYLSLCKHLLEMAIKKATIGQKSFVEEMKKNPSSAAIKECATDLYDGLVNSFISSLGELTESPDTANYDAKVAGDGPNYCQDALYKEKIDNPVLFNINNEMSFLSLVAFYATNYLPEDQ